MEKNLTVLWESLTEEEKKEVTYDLSKLCNVSAFAVYYWARGFRKPKRASQELIDAYLEERAEKKGTEL